MTDSSVRHWNKHISQIKRPSEYTTGYSCWFFPRSPVDTEEFLYWMKEHMSGPYDATPRFNSGDPMVVVFIREDVDANLFTLKWR